ncbi:MAG: carboxylesterase [Burkholderiales bacterium]|nr:carboxylesterase [Burkholderiales bacterium]
MSAMLETIEISTGEQPDAAIIWLHGLGADGNDFVPVIDELELPPGAAVRFVFPHAPMMPVSINNGYVMRAWYDVHFDGVDKRADDAGIRSSQLAIERLLERERERGIAPQRTLLAGFSQGGAIALQTGLRHPARLAGVMALSTYLPLADSLASERAMENAATPIFMAHGRHDGVIAIQLAQRSVQRLRALGYAVEWRDYAMEHSVCMQEIADISQWLGRVLARS